MCGKLCSWANQNFVHRYVLRQHNLQLALLIKMTEPQELTFVLQFHRLEPRITAPLSCGCNVSWKVALGTAGLATHGINEPVQAACADLNTDICSILSVYSPWWSWQKCGTACALVCEGMPGMHRFYNFDRFLGKRLGRAQIQTSGRKKRLQWRLQECICTREICWHSCVNSANMAQTRSELVPYVWSELFSQHTFFIPFLFGKWAKSVQVSGPLLRAVCYVCFAESTTLRGSNFGQYKVLAHL